jgi:hypothetical protein
MMRWPSRDPEDYMTRGHWEDDPPAWLARLRGTTNPDRPPWRLVASATLAGVAAGALIEAVEGSGASQMLPFLVALLARTLLDAAWWLTRKRRQASHRPAKRSV